jgi:hypothetical protein
MTPRARLVARFRLRLASPDLEHRYLLDRLPANRNTLASVLIVAALFQVINLFTDRMIAEPGRNFEMLLAIRLTSAFLAVSGALLVRRLREPRRFEAVATAWGILTALGVVVSFAFLPEGYTAHTAWSVFLVLAMYVVLPVPMLSQVMVASIFTIGDAVILSYLKVLDLAVIRTDILTAHACAHVIGLVVSWQFQRSRRDQFLAHREAELAHTQEQRALGELNVLKGILPICSHCKRIRTDEGDWSQVEVYVRRHSEADFSHSICPDCERDMYGDLPTRTGVP